MSPSSDILPDRPLAESIAVATRSSHTRLNKSIIARLPLVTSASNPSSYITGMLHIAPIYMTFEACWKTILDTPCEQDEARQKDSRPSIAAFVDDNNPANACANKTLQVQEPAVCGRVRPLLQQLRLPGLMRSSRLRADIRALTGWSERVLEEQLQLAGRNGRLGDFTAHIKRSVEHRPHVLIAYSYILYMALFAGGRFIRATLESTGDAFWNATPSPVKPNMVECRPRSFNIDTSAAQENEPGASPSADGAGNEDGTPLSFFYFTTPEDGEDLKREFKSRLLDAESLLSHDEKCDIIQESICIFDSMELLVSQLDKVCAEGEGKDGAESMGNLSTLMGKSIIMRLRDSVAVTKDRAARSSSRMTSSDESDSDPASRNGYGSEKATSAASLARHSVPGHPLIPSTVGAIELCPALKSMRFDSNLPIPIRGAAKATEGMKGVYYTNWLLMAAFGAIVIGAVMTTRRQMITA
ncbi:hypothetical protein NLU13_9430 [Sarocladium strictum]|uniref:Heme oxygenase n=1 Tax=Sarocladium strictum TaxID=5046 RepID=A0AA39GAQ3_SARSR|nr:hypothetical protein NLU13_9430 [Sarocladium strictum]